MGEDVRPKKWKLEPEICSKHKCIEDKDPNKLQCHSCKRRVHYQCTLLPIYQVQLHRYSTHAKGFSSYVCINCVEVPEFLQNANWDGQKTFKEKYDEELEKSIALKHTVSRLNRKLQNLEKELYETKKQLTATKSKEKKKSIEGNAVDDKKKQ